MKIKIFQIDLNKDNKHVAFLGTWYLNKYKIEIDFTIYKEVYDGNIECKNLEEIFEMFNINRPADFKGWSLSVSDIVQVVEDCEIQSGYYFCDSFGWKVLTIQN